MDKKILTEINRNRELMSLGKVLINEAVDPVSILEKFLGKSFSTITAKLTGTELERFAAKFVSEMQEVAEKTAAGKTLEEIGGNSQLGRRILRTVLEKAEYTGLRQTIAQGIVNADYATIKNIFSRFPNLATDRIQLGQAMRTLGVELGIPPGIAKEFVGEWNKAVEAETGAMGKFGTETGERAAEVGGERGAEDIGSGVVENGLDDIPDLLSQPEPENTIYDTFKKEIDKFNLPDVKPGWENEFLDELRASVNNILTTKEAQRLLKNAEELEKAWPSLAPTKREELLTNAINGTNKLANKNTLFGKFSKYLTSGLSKAKGGNNIPPFKNWVKYSMLLSAASIVLDLVRAYESGKMKQPFKGHFGMSWPGVIVAKVLNSLLGPFSIFMNGFFFADSAIRTVATTATYGATTDAVKQREDAEKAKKDAENKAKTDAITNPDITVDEAKAWVESNDNPLQLDPKTDLPVKYVLSQDKKTVDVFVPDQNEKIATVKKLLDVGGISKIVEVK